MAKVEISEKLKEEIFKKFKDESKKVFSLMFSLKENPNKGKIVGKVSEILIKEIKYGSFKFYFITDGHKLRIMDSSEIEELLIRFVRMSNKKTQQKVIDEIKELLRKFGSSSNF
ncbi:MAG: hypothetical protein NUV46_01535 [Nanoarchaeota archaeon]|nr:hypothetical protein [Nanoarchaeota archaeon]